MDMGMGLYSKVIRRGSDKNTVIHEIALDKDLFRELQCMFDTQLIFHAIIIDNLFMEKIPFFDYKEVGKEIIGYGQLLWDERLAWFQDNPDCFYHLIPDYDKEIAETNIFYFKELAWWDKDELTALLHVDEGFSVYKHIKIKWDA